MALSQCSDGGSAFQSRDRPSVGGQFPALDGVEEPLKTLGEVSLLDSGVGSPASRHRIFWPAELSGPLRITGHHERVEAGQLVALCPGWKVNRRLKLTLLVDGAVRGRLRRGQAIQLTLLNGVHDVVFSTRSRGQVDLMVELADDDVFLVCTANYPGLLAADESAMSGVWTGPPPIEAWVQHDVDLPEEPVWERTDLWFTRIESQREAMSHSPYPVMRFLARVGNSGVLAVWLILFFGFAAYEAVRDGARPLLGRPLHPLCRSGSGRTHCRDCVPHVATRKAG